ncbi:hypothetical protein QBC37DRAFT_105940 [Rhypophila decipiens]|uniref:Uncharacterized protein n=1 Tax=Rhypophila decipiens TaxID=261697 RepID=A0AAN6YB20_9PEZI|nr:hypothetical protein QBC37DRAFT_105940 [Rhypophila decipiens]
MAVTMDQTRISPPDISAIVTPVLSALPGASLSTEPSVSVLPLLSPILRQRVQLLSAGSKEPWIRLLTWDAAKASKLALIAQSGSLEAHPVSGEIEVDWDYNVQTRHKRLDKETLQTLVVLGEFDLFVRLVYCMGDAESDGEGWKIGEVGVASNPSPLDSFGGYRTLTEAEEAFQATQTAGSKGVGAVNTGASAPVYNDDKEEEDDDDDYWARYDATPARTPAVKRSPAPQSMAGATSNLDIHRSQSAEDAYYAQYDSVQPAMDNHDPDEVVEGESSAAAPLGLAKPLEEQSEIGETSGAWTLAEPPRSPSIRSQDENNRVAELLHPRPASSASSTGSLTVAKLEETAERQEQNEFGVKQHISRSIRSLFLLSRSAGIDREEFERMVKTELDVLGMVEDDI